LGENVKSWAAYRLTPRLAYRTMQAFSYWATLCYCRQNQ